MNTILAVTKSAFPQGKTAPVEADSAAVFQELFQQFLLGTFTGAAASAAAAFVAALPLPATAAPEPKVDPEITEEPPPEEGDEVVYSEPAPERLEDHEDQTVPASTTTAPSTPQEESEGDVQATAPVAKPLPTQPAAQPVVSEAEAKLIQEAQAILAEIGKSETAAKADSGDGSKTPVASDGKPGAKTSTAEAILDEASVDTATSSAERSPADAKRAVAQAVTPQSAESETPSQSAPALGVASAADAGREDARSESDPRPELPSQPAKVSAPSTEQSGTSDQPLADTPQEAKQQVPAFLPREGFAAAQSGAALREAATKSIDKPLRPLTSQVIVDPLERRAVSPDRQRPSLHELPRSTQRSVIDHIQKLLDDSKQNQSKNQLVLRLDPPELGRLTVKVSQRADQVFARLVPESHHTEALLRGQVREIAAQLASAGFNGENVHVSVGSGEHEVFRDFHQESNGESHLPFSKSVQVPIDVGGTLPVDVSAADEGWVA